MMATTEEHKDRIYDTVSQYVTKNQDLLPQSIRNNSIELSHVISTGTTLMMCKWGLDKKEHQGGFVNAVLDNDLTGAISSADSTNQDALVFYCKLMYNLGYIQ